MILKCEYSKMIIRNLKPLSDEFQERAIPDYKDNLDLFLPAILKISILNMPKMF